MSGVKHVTHTVKATHYNKITIIELKMILTHAGQAQRLSHICTSKILGVFNGIQTHDLCNAGGLPFNSSIKISFTHNNLFIIIQNEAMWIIFMTFKLNTIIQNFQVLKRAIIDYFLPTFCSNLCHDLTMLIKDWKI